MQQTYLALPALSHVHLLPFVQTHGQFYFLLHHTLPQLSFIGGQMQLHDQRNPLAFALNFLTNNHPALLKLASIVVQKEESTSEVRASRWLLESLADLPRTIEGDQIVIPLRIDPSLDLRSITSIIEQEMLPFALKALSQIQQMSSQETFALVEQTSKSLLEKRKSSYFGVLNCSTGTTCSSELVSLLLVGSLLNAEDRWKVFKAPLLQLPSCLDIQSKRLKGVVISGSACASYDTQEWILNLKEFLFKISSVPDIKLLGTCFGHQILALALGGKVGKMEHSIFVKKQERILLTSALSSCQFAEQMILPREVVMQELHGDEIKELPKGYEVYGRSESCKYECVGRGKQILSTQFHPEYLLVFVKKRILPLFKSGSEQRIAHSETPDNFKFREIQYSFLHCE